MKAEATAAVTAEQRNWCDAIASRMWRRLRRVGGFTADDIHSACLVALYECAARYDAGRGVPFEAFARRRVYGAAVDYVRALHGRRRPPKGRRAARTPPPFLTAEAVLRAHAEAVMEACDSNAEAARALGVSQKTVYNWRAKWQSR